MVSKKVVNLSLFSLLCAMLLHVDKGNAQNPTKLIENAKKMRAELEKKVKEAPARAKEAFAAAKKKEEEEKVRLASAEAAKKFEEYLKGLQSKFRDKLFHAIENRDVDAVKEALKEKLSVERAYAAISHAYAVQNKFLEGGGDSLKKASEIENLLKKAYGVVYYITCYPSMSSYSYSTVPAVVLKLTAGRSKEVTEFNFKKGDFSKKDLEFLVRLAECKLASWTKKIPEEHARILSLIPSPMKKGMQHVGVSFTEIKRDRSIRERAHTYRVGEHCRKKDYENALQKLKQELLELK